MYNYDDIRVILTISRFFSHFFKLLALISDGKLKIKHEHTKSARLVYLNTRDICPNMRSAYIIRDLFVTENNA